MTIVFLHVDQGKIYICTETDKIKIVDINDPMIAAHLPDDDILYVQKGQFITKTQFINWMSDSPVESDSHEQSAMKNKFYIHPTKNGVIHINDISTNRYPNGIKLEGKYHFIAVDDIGQDAMDESSEFQVLFAQGKIERVNGQHVRAHAHKRNKQESASERSLNAILVPSHIKARTAAESLRSGENGSGRNNDDPIEIIIG